MTWFRSLGTWWWWLLTATLLVQESHEGLLSDMVSGLRELPIIGNVLKASVHPIYRPIVKQFQSRIDSTEHENEIVDFCFGELGCITHHDDFFHPIHRPLNLPPNSREEIHLVFTVHTRKDAQGTAVEALYLPKVLATSFNSSRNTKIIIHGFLETNTETWMWDMVRAFLAYEDLNVVTVDWSGGSHALYSQATANTRVVGLEVAHFINWLKDKADLNPGDVHIIGHSLGAHSAGYAGERVPGLGRITGLDPAEPYFQYMPTSVRLDPSDALFVDVIHTDADSILNIGQGYGLRQPIGHLDFYPNDGRNQPGCDSLIRVPMTALTDGVSMYEGFDAAQKELVACNHFRAPKFFTESILSTCPYVAFRCRSYQRYLAGKCVNCGEDGSQCANLGLQADTWPGLTKHKDPVRLYLSTAPRPRYCLYHYLVTMELADPEGIKGSLWGNLKFSFVANDGSIIEFNITPESPKSFKRGNTYSYFLSHREDLSSASEALVHWSYEADMFNPLTYCVPIFCDTSLPLLRLTFTSVDNISFGRKRETAENSVNTTATMCHKQGLGVVKVASESMVKVVSSPTCLTITNTTTNTNNTTIAHHLLLHHQHHHYANLTQELFDASLNSLSSFFEAQEEREKSALEEIGLNLVMQGIERVLGRKIFKNKNNKRKEG